MNPTPDAERLTAFIDGELDLQSQLAMEQRLRDDVDLRQRVDELRRLRESVREGASYHAAPDALKARIAALAPKAAPGTTQRAPIAASARAAGATLAGWLAWRPLAGALAFVAVLAVAANVVWLSQLDERRLTDDVIASHVRASLSQRLVDVASSDHHTVKPWLSSRLDFSPPVENVAVPDASFLGGRVDYVDGRAVAALVYRVGQHVLTAFVWPADARDREPTFERHRGFETVHWVGHDMNHWVVSDLNRDECHRFVQALRQAENAR